MSFRNFKASLVKSLMFFNFVPLGINAFDPTVIKPCNPIREEGDILVLQKLFHRTPLSVSPKSPPPKLDLNLENRINSDVAEFSDMAVGSNLKSQLAASATATRAL